MTLSEIIIQYRHEHGLSQRQMASLCSLSTGYISLIEKEVNPQTGKPMVPSLTVLNKLAKGMATSLDGLLSACDDMPVDISYEGNAPELAPQPITPQERELLEAYHEAPPPIRDAVDGLLAPYKKAHPAADHAAG